MMKKKMQMGGKAKPMSGKVGAYAEIEKKSKAGDSQAKADLKLEKSNYKKFGDGPGSGPSGAMPKPKMKMGGKMAKQAAVAIAMKKAGKTPMKKAMSGAAMGAAPTMKKGGMMKKCKDGCK